AVPRAALPRSGRLLHAYQVHCPRYLASNGFTTAMRADAPDRADADESRWLAGGAWTDARPTRTANVLGAISVPVRLLRFCVTTKAWAEADLRWAPFRQRAVNVHTPVGESSAADHVQLPLPTRSV